MIIRSSFIRSYDLAGHLTSDANEHVAIRHDLHRDAPVDLATAIRAFVALSRTNTRMERELLHIKMSPAHDCSEAELSQSIQTIEAEHKIKPSVPRIVVAHLKGKRVTHYHFVYPAIDPDSGKAIDSRGNYLKDEIASRRLELAFNEPITPGPRQEAVIERLRERGCDAEAAALVSWAAAERGHRVSDASLQAASRLGIDGVKLAARISKAWHTAADDSSFMQVLKREGLRLAKGDRAILVVDDSSGYALPLARTLRQVAKAEGTPIELRERELRERFANAPPYKVAREDGLAEALRTARNAVGSEVNHIIFEAEDDGDDVLALRLKRVRARIKRQEAAGVANTLKAKRAEIERGYRQRDAIRRRRVDRAFRTARWLDNDRFRDTAMVIAASAMVLSGGGLGLAFLAAGLAAGMIPSFERARAIARYEQLNRIDDREKRVTEIRNLGSVAHAWNNSDKRPQVDFAKIPKGDRILVGALARRTLEAMDLQDGKGPDERADRIRRALGNELATQIEDCVKQGSGRAALRMMSWFDPRKVAHQRAIDTALNRTADRRSKKASRPERQRRGGHGIAD